MRLDALAMPILAAALRYLNIMLVLVFRGVMFVFRKLAKIG